MRTQNQKEETEKVLLERARDEEKDYNWIEAANKYELAVNYFLDRKLEEKAAEALKKQAYVYSQAAITTSTTKDYLRFNKSAIRIYKKAAKLFIKNNNEPESLECEAEALFVSGFIKNSVTGVIEAFNKSYTLFIKSKDQYSKKNDQESVARTFIRASVASFFLAFSSSEKEVIEEFCQKGREMAGKAWEISRKIGDHQLISESLFAEAELAILEANITPFKWSKEWEDYFKKLVLKADESLKILVDCTDSKILGMAQLAAGFGYNLIGFQFIEDEKGQNEYADKGIKLLENSLQNARKSRDNFQIIILLVYLNWWSLFWGRFKDLQTRIFDNINELVEYGRKYSGFYTYYSFYTNYLPSFIYANFAQRSFFTTEQRIMFAENSIHYSKECLKVYSSTPTSAWVYQMLTWSYSQLTTLTTIKDKQEEYAQEMLRYARSAEKIAEKYEGGWTRASGYSSLYRAFKTLADITQNKEKKIKMLTSAAAAADKYVGHAVESRTGVIGAQIRAGLLYEELGIITNETNTLMKSKEIFLGVIKECHTRGYYSYAAAAYEYIAHVEERLANHKASEQYYKKAQEMHKESLKTIEYKPLQDRVKEKIDYAHAWSLIERAKAYHKREDQLKAKESYERASQILKDLQRFNYEAPYYSSWALQEEAEYLSKQEKHEEAIERYETTKENFSNAIERLGKAFQRIADKRERTRIEKLKDIAKMRISYCSARVDIERARILGKKGNLLIAAEKFGSAASQFSDISTLSTTDRERRELEAVYYLCRAWENMELAEKYEDPNRFAEAANLFTKANKLFIDSKLKFLASGNSVFCQALELGCKFDETTEIQIKSQLYPKIKAMLRKAASTYRKGGFESGADWALATATYFEATWHLIKSDEEMELEEKKKLLGIGSRYLKSAAELFGKSGYKNKEKEVSERLYMVEKEEIILVSALNTIKEPSISMSTVGIVAPTSPVETSLSSGIGEIRQFTEEARRVAEERAPRKKYELVYRDLLKEHPKIQRRECRVAIAQLGLSKTGDIFSEFYEEEAPGIFGFREDKVEIVRSKVKNMIEIAFSKGANIIIFPELTIDLNYNQLLEDITNLAKAYEMYIIPGSYHDRKTKQNLSIVINPDGILWEQRKHIPANIHYEGKRVKEGIAAEIGSRKTIISNTEFGRITIVICRDFLDMDLRVELKNFEPPVDLIFNPAFTPVTADFKAAHFDARRSIYAYCFFVNVAEFGESLIYTPEKERIERNIPAGEETIIYKDVDLFQLRAERKRWEKEQKKAFIQSTR